MKLKLPFGKAWIASLLLALGSGIPLSIGMAPAGPDNNQSVVGLVDSGRHPINDSHTPDHALQTTYGLHGFQGARKSDTARKPEISVWGSVQTELGTVSSNDRVAFYSASHNKKYVASSDQNGHYFIDHLLAADDYQMTVDSAGMFKRAVLGPLQIDSDLVLAPVVLKALTTGTLSGVIIDTEGSAVPQYQLKVSSGVRYGWSAKIESDHIGKFRLKNVPEGPLLFTSMAGRVLRITGHHFAAQYQEPLILRVDEGGYHLQGIVYNQNNEPVAGANVIVGWKNNHNGKRSVINRRTMTNNEGEFALKGLGGGDHDLVLATSAGEAHKQVVTLTDEITDLTIVLSRDVFAH